MVEVAVGLGSNLGDREANIQDAIRLLGRAIVIASVSKVIETEPMYLLNQPRYLNAVAVGACARGPLSLVAALKDIECQIGRQARSKNAPREIDLDLLVFGALKLHSEGGAYGVQVPHALLHEREFVLRPLTEIAPQMLIPGHGTAANLVAKLNEKRLQKV